MKASKEGLEAVKWAGTKPERLEKQQKPLREESCSPIAASYAMLFDKVDPDGLVPFSRGSKKVSHEKSSRIQRAEVTSLGATEL